MKRIICVFLAVVLLTALPVSISLNVMAAEDKDTIVTIPLDVMSEELWTVENGAAFANEDDLSLSFTVPSGAKNTALVFSAEFEKIDLSEFNELVLDIEADTDAKEVEYTVTVGKGASATSYTEVADPSRGVIYIPLESSAKEALTSLKISALSADNEINLVTLYSVSADTGYTYAFLKSFFSTNAVSQNKMILSNNEIFLYPENGSCDVTFTFADTFTQKTDILSWISFSGTEAGNIRATTTDAEGNVYETASQSITKSGKYSFLSKGGFETLTVHFEGMPSGATVITVHEAGLYTMGVTRDSVGTVSSCKYDGKKITISGTISNEASVKYNGSKILLYAIPVTDSHDPDIHKYTPAATFNFSTKFKISIAQDINYSEYFYKVVLDTKDGLLSIGDIRTPASGASAPAASSVTAIHGADAADVFEANLSTVILDVSADLLVDKENTYSSEIYNYGKIYYFNKDYLNQLDDSIRFFDSAGIGVYLRLYSDSEAKAFDYSANDEKKLSLLCATASFLAERYTSAKGFIMGESVNDLMGELSPERASDVARLICVFTEAVKAKMPDCAVVIPYSANNEADPFVACAMINYFLYVYKPGSIVSMYVADTNELLSPVCAARLSSIAALFSASSDGTAVLWNVPSSYSVQDLCACYRTLCVSGTAQGLRFAAVSVADSERSPALYDSLKSMINEESVILANTMQYNASIDPESFRSSYSLWDFTSTYDTSGWVSGGSFSDPFTAKGDNGERVLRVENTGSFGGSGIIICKTQTPLDLSELFARISMSVISETAESAEIVMIFGSGKDRAEYSATINCNEKTNLICDLRDFAGASKVDFASVIVRAGNDANAEISKIEVCSKELSHSTLESRFHVEEPTQHQPVLYAVIIFITAGTVAVFSVLLRKQKKQTKGERHE